IRKLTTQPLCPVCRVDTKSVKHLARDRSFIKQGVVTFVKAYIGEINALDTPSKPMTVMREDRWVPLMRESMKASHFFVPCTSVTGRSLKPVTIAQNAFDEGLLCRWRLFSPQELAQFGNLLEKPVRLKP
ncbi:hypothetical protein Gorai_024145, partial [Gossypium raimondii]|nr:hypothetical protein [Gossypium raimondii]